MHKKRVVGGDEEITFWRDLLTGDSATESRYVGVEASRQRHHLLAHRSQGVAGAMTLEQGRAYRRLDLPEAAKHGRLIDAQPR